MRVKIVAAASALIVLSACFGGGAPSELLTLTRRASPDRAAAHRRPGEAIHRGRADRAAGVRTTRIPRLWQRHHRSVSKDAVWVEIPARCSAG